MNFHKSIEMNFVYIEMQDDIKKMKIKIKL
jgi:hypothetical protein